MDDILLQYRQLGDIFDTFSMGVMVVGADRKIISLNHSAEIITGYNESDLQGKYCHHTLLDQLCGGQCEYISAVESGRQAGSVAFEISDRSDEKFIAINSAAIPEKSKQVLMKLKLLIQQEQR